MKLKDADIVLVPGLGNSGPDHWMTRWEEKIATARRAELGDWDAPNLEGWTAALIAAVNPSERPVVLVAHSAGVPTVVHAAPKFTADVRGAFLVAPPHVDDLDYVPESVKVFSPYPETPLPFPSFTISSKDDPYAPQTRVQELANAWGSFFIDAGEQQHLNTESGHGPWPEGLMVFSKFLSRI